MMSRHENIEENLQPRVSNVCMSHKESVSEGITCLYALFCKNLSLQMEVEVFHVSFRQHSDNKSIISVKRKLGETNESLLICALNLLHSLTHVSTELMWKQCLLVDKML